MGVPAFTRADYDAALRADLMGYFVWAWSQLHPSQKLISGWHLHALSAALTKCATGQTKRLIINLPPRNLKSEFASIVFPTWLLGREPSRKIINITYSEALTKDFARGSKALMETADYKRMFPATRINPRANADADFTLMKHRGKRFGTTVFGPITGFGGDFLIIDDPIKPEDARSDTVRTRVNEWFESTALSRLDRKETGCIIVIMQRLHVDDLSGRLLEAGGWTHLNLPALATERQALDAGLGLTWTREIGDPLNPRFESKETLAAIRESMGEDFFESQYQQSPVMPGGNVVKLGWLQRYRAPFRATMDDEVVFSWDTAFGTGDNNDWSVGTVWIVRGKDYYLGDIVRGRFSGGDLVTAVANLWNRYPTTRRVILLEKVNGMELVAEQVRQACPDVDLELVPPVQNKVSRLWASTPIFQRGAVHLPDHAPWLDEYVKELISFPRAKHDDQVDATSQFLGWITTKPDLTVVQRSW